MPLLDVMKLTFNFFQTGMTEPEVFDAIDQFYIKHLILFEGVDAHGVKDVLMQYFAFRKAQLHSAKIIGPSHCGQFEFTSKHASN